MTLVQGTAICAGCLVKSNQKAEQAKRMAFRIMLVLMIIMFGFPTLVCVGCLASGNRQQRAAPGSGP